MTRVRVIGMSDISTEKTVAECILGRRTVREFSDQKIKDNILNEILKGGIYAPSACNFQAWKIILIENQDDKEAIISLYSEPHKQGWVADTILSCSHLLIMTYRNDFYVSGREYGDYIQSAAAALENIALMAFNYDIGACWICNLPNHAVMKNYFSIPDNYDVIAFMALGYPINDVGSSDNAQKFHYGSTKCFKKHKRRYTMEQFVSKRCFTRTTGDSSYLKSIGSKWSGWNDKRDTNEINSSVTAGIDYIDFVTKAVVNDEVFHDFRRANVYRRRVECPTFKQSLDMLDFLDQIWFHWRKNQDVYLDNDNVGNPITFSYESLKKSGKEYAAPYTIQKIMELAMIKTMFPEEFLGENMKVAEIGVGFGGFFRLFQLTFNTSLYVMFDLKSVLKLTSKYLDNFNDVNKDIIEYRTFPYTAENFDLVISCNAFSELAPDLQNLYIQNIMKRARHGFIIHNPLGKDKFGEGYEPVNYLYDIPRCRISPLKWPGVKYKDDCFWRNCCIISW